MLKFDPKKTPIPKLHHLLLGSVAPRPIAFASTIDREGNPNLSPFSFYNAFGVNPTTLIFSPSRRGRDNTTKHTYDNIKEIPEVVINAVNYNLVQQASLSSTEYPQGVNEFIKSGLTAMASETIRPYRVKESPVQFECKVREVIETGTDGGAGNLIICEIMMIHLDEKILDPSGNIDPHKIDLVGRMGGDYYCRTSGDNVFTVEKPLQRLGIGIDQLPDKIKFSKYLSGNDLGKLGNIESLPNKEEIRKAFDSNEFSKKLDGFSQSRNQEKEIHLFAKELLESGRVFEALCVLMEGD
ncbi:MAG: flavin reductase family protein [Chlorobi bacterium]|nr:flavin reductase family protein [Chlorobiota bacterium]